MMWLLIIFALALAAAFALSLYEQRRDYRAGQEAHRSGQPLNVGWTQAKRNGWADSWHEGIRNELEAASRHR